MISFAIMAHPSRRELVLDKLEGELDGAVVSMDSATASEEWRTGRAALLMAPEAATWHVVVQDDAVLPPRFREHVRRALSAADSGGPVGLYVGQARPRARLVTRAVAAAERAGARWLRMGGPWWGVAVAFPVALIPELVERADAMRHPFYDARLARAVKESGRWCTYPLPSLVDHDPSVPSLIHTSAGEHRRAHRFVGETEPEAIEWCGTELFVDQRGRFSTPSPAALDY